MKDYWVLPERKYAGALGKHKKQAAGQKPREPPVITSRMSPEYAARTGSINTTKLIKMKRLLLLLTCFIFVFQACEKDEIMKPNEVIVDKIEFEVLNGILSFDSADEFYALGEKLTTLSQEELVRWENKTGFV